MGGNKSVVPNRESGPEPNGRLRNGFYQRDVDDIVGRLKAIQQQIANHDREDTLLESVRLLGSKVDAHTTAINRLVEALKGIHLLVNQTGEDTRSLAPAIGKLIQTSVAPHLEELLAQLSDGLARVELLIKTNTTQPQRPSSQDRIDRQGPFDERKTPQHPAVDRGQSSPAVPIPPELAAALTRELPGIKQLLAEKPDEAANALRQLRDDLPQTPGAIPKWLREKLKDSQIALERGNQTGACNIIGSTLERIRSAARPPQNSPEGSRPPQNSPEGSRPPQSSPEGSRPPQSSPEGSRPPQSSPEGSRPPHPPTKAASARTESGRPGGTGPLGSSDTGVTRGGSSPEGSLANSAEPITLDRDQRQGTRGERLAGSSEARNGLSLTGAEALSETRRTLSRSGSQNPLAGFPAVAPGGSSPEGNDLSYARDQGALATDRARPGGYGPQGSLSTRSDSQTMETIHGDEAEEHKEPDSGVPGGDQPPSLPTMPQGRPDDDVSSHLVLE